MRFDAIPIWAVFAGTIILVWIAIEAGYLVGRGIRRKSEDEKESPVSAIAGAILGLSAFMLAFTFGIVTERQAVKRSLVRDDAVAIRTAWQRADFLPDSDRAEAKDLLRQYVDVRVTFAQAVSLEPEHVRSAMAETQRIQDRLWEMAVANARLDMNSDVTALYIDSLNEVNGIHVQRVAVGMQARIPIEIWLALYCITIMGMMGVGYQTGIAGSKRSMARPLLAASFALVFALIASLDRPDSGVMPVTQQPLIDLQQSMRFAAVSSNDLNRIPGVGHGATSPPQRHGTLSKGHRYESQAHQVDHLTGVWVGAGDGDCSFSGGASGAGTSTDATAIPRGAAAGPAEQAGLG